MSLPTRDELIECVRRSGLLEEERLARFLADSATQAIRDPKLLAKAFETAGLLTAWQKDRLLEKKWKGFYLGKYKILYPLGAGAMGSVFLAEHKVMRHSVALKVLAKRLVAKPSNVTRFEREARAAAAVNHPNVVRAFDIDREGETHYLIMEYVKGENIQKLVQQQGPLDPLLAADYIAQIARGLNEAHANGLVHRDIKPSNVLLDQTGLMKILDLGLARIAQEDDNAITVVNESKLLGTVDYLAPEQAVNSHRIDGRADIYSLGCTLYFMLTGLPPFPSGSLTERILKHQTKRPMDIRKRREGVPDALVNICNRMMEKNADKRYNTAGDCADALVAFVEGRLEELYNNEALRGVDEAEDGGVLSYAEDSSSGRSGILGSKTLAGRSSKSLSALRSRGASSSGGSKANTGVVDLDLTPKDAHDTKKSSVSLAMSAPAEAPVEKKKKPEKVAAGGGGGSRGGSDDSQAGRSLIDLELAGLQANITPEMSLFDDALSLAGSSSLSPLDGNGSLLEVGAAGDTVSNSAGLTASHPKVDIFDPLAAALPTEPAPAAKESVVAAPIANQATSPVNWVAFLQGSDGEFNYPLWFLILAGLFLSGFMFLVGYFFQSAF
jgi:eukaryotic-like serine/threonine-protein kinase